MNSVVATRVTGVDVNWSIPRAVRPFLDSSFTYGQPVVNGRAQVEGTINAEWDDTTVAYYDLFRSGAMVGLMNMVAQVGGLVGSVAYGYIVERAGNYDAPFVPMTVMLILGALLWAKVDASRELAGA